MIIKPIQAQQADHYNIRGQFNTSAFYQTGISSDKYITSYKVDLSYGILTNFDTGIYYSNNFRKDRNEYEVGINLRYYFTQLILRNPKKTYMYIKGNIAKQWVTTHHEYWEGVNEDIYTQLKNIGGMIGCRYMLLGRLGVMTEFGYQLQTDWTVNIGLSFRIK
jgi:hypothetical protein